MKNLMYALALLFSFALPFNSWADDDHVRAKDLVESGEILSLEQLLQTVFEGRNWRLLEAELEEKHGQYIYELEILDDRGKVRELKYDARTGKPMHGKKK